MVSFLQLFLYDIFFYLLPVVAINFFIGIISWPFTSIFFKKLSDKGYSISHFIGWIILAYLYFVLASFGIFNLSVFSLLTIFTLWVFVNVGIQLKFQTLDLKNIDFKQIIFIQLFFIFLSSFWVFVRGFDAELYQVERFMDYGFMKSLFNARELPLFDFWMLGETVNYYYFSHFVTYCILLISKVNTVSGFFVVVCWLFGLVGINTYRFGKDFFQFLVQKSNKSNLKSILAGVFSVIFMLFSGTLHTSIWHFENLKYLISKFLSKFTAIEILPKPNYWYADSTRYIQDTITEMPIYDFMVADLHPNVWGQISGIVILSLLLLMWIDKKRKMDFKNPYVYLLTFFIGIAYMLNSWDALTLGVLSMVLIITRYWKQLIEVFKINWVKLRKHLKQKANFMQTIVILILIPILGYTLALPWSITMELPIEGIGFVHEKAKEHRIATLVEQIFQWFMFWGGFLILFKIFFFKNLIKSPKGILSQDKNAWYIDFEVVWKFFKMKKYIRFIFFSFLVVCLFWILQEIFYVKDLLSDGQWYRANTVFKISFQLWIILALLTGPLILDLLSKTKIFFVKLIIYFMIFTIVFVHISYVPKILWQGSMDSKEYKGLRQGLEWWKDKYPDDFEAFQYLERYRNSLKSDDKIRKILEAEGDSFEDNNFYSTFLGWPTVIGWAVHEWTWRGTYDGIGERRAEVKEVYTGYDVERSKEILEKYQIDFIIIGGIEKRIYDDSLKEEKLMELGDVFFENEEVKILRVNN